MISKGKRKHLVDLYRPVGEFFTRQGKLCVKVPGAILVGLVPQYGRPTNVSDTLAQGQPLMLDFSWLSTSTAPNQK